MLRRQARRVRRVTLGLIRPSSRATYVAAIRSIRGWPPKTHVAGQTAFITLPAPDAARVEACVICGHSPVRLIDLQERRGRRRRLTVRVCPSCGHVANPDNTFDYRVYRSADEMTPGPRIGTDDHVGREFHMAALAAEILDRPGLDVLVYGVGRSLDNHHIARLDSVASVSIADIMRVRDDAPFVQADEPAPRQFDIVVASEVVEHFLDPNVDLPHLFGFVEDDGLLVCSTNIMDGRDVTTLRYPFFRGHVSLYSPRSLAIVARRNGSFIDFRLPRTAVRANRQKRYVLFSRSAEVMTRVAEYFGAHALAPSDDPSERQLH